MKAIKKDIISMCQPTEQLNFISFHNINCVCKNEENKTMHIGLETTKIQFLSAPLDFVAAKKVGKWKI